MGQVYDSIVYINPDFSGVEQGTKSNPYNDWDNDITFNSNTAYLQKRGTTITNTSEMLVQGKDNVKIGAYGAGTTKPIINNIIGEGIVKLHYSSGCLVDSIEFTGDIEESIFGVYISGFWQAGSNSSYNNTITNCIMHDMYNGIRSMPYSTSNDTLTVNNCEIYDIHNDGIFVQQADCTNVRNSNIYRINMGWHLVPGAHGNDLLSTGDCIQFALGMPRWSVKNTIMDRRYTGNKFCFIYNTGGALTTGRGLLEDNTFYPPKDTTGGDGGAAIFLKWANNVTFRNNITIGEGYPGGDDSHVSTLSSSNVDTIAYYGNLFKNTHNFNVGAGVTLLDLVNNTFANTVDFGGEKIIISDAPAIYKNNVIAIRTADIPYQWNSGVVSTTNHLIEGSSATWTTNPSFVSTSDFNLLVGSTLVNNGTNDANITIDLGGTARPQDGTMDIGAYEYTPVGGGSPVTGTRNVSSGGVRLTNKGKTLKL